MKKTRCVIFSKTKTKYVKEVPFIYNDEPIPFETFYKYLGVEIANNCEFNIVKKERNIKARKAIFSIRQALATSGNVSVKLAMKLFDSKIEPILTYGSVIWGIENSKLAEKGISGNFYFLLKNMYSNCSYAIKVLLPCNPLCGEKNTKKKTNTYQ